MVLLELKLKPPLTIPVSNQLFLKVSDNFRLIEVLPDVPTVVPLDLCLGVHLEVLTSSDSTLVIPTTVPVEAAIFASFEICFPSQSIF